MRLEDIELRNAGSARSLEDATKSLKTNQADLRRIADKKTGKTTSLDGLDASNLAGLLDDVLNDPDYRDNSRSIQKAIAKRNGLSVAAELLEQAFGSTKKTKGFLQKTA